MKLVALIAAFLLTAIAGYTQILMTRTGQASFHSNTILENINAVNKNVSAIIDVGKKNLAFKMYLKEFIFEKKLMQEHFNENYVESDKYPTSTFSGSYTGLPDFRKDGSYPVQVSGKLTLHGVTREVNVRATLTVRNGTVTGTSTFRLNPKDFNISIPFIVRDKIEKENTVKIKVDWPIKN